MPLAPPQTPTPLSDLLERAMYGSFWNASVEPNDVPLALTTKTEPQNLTMIKPNAPTIMISNDSTMAQPDTSGNTPMQMSTATGLGAASKKIKIVS